MEEASFHCLRSFSRFNVLTSFSLVTAGAPIVGILKQGVQLPLVLRLPARMVDIVGTHRSHRHRLSLTGLQENWYN